MPGGVQHKSRPAWPSGNEWYGRTDGAGRLSVTASFAMFYGAWRLGDTHTQHNKPTQQAAFSSCSYVLLMDTEKKRGASLSYVVQGVSLEVTPRL